MPGVKNNILILWSISGCYCKPWLHEWLSAPEKFGWKTLMKQ